MQRFPKGSDRLGSFDWQKSTAECVFDGKKIKSLKITIGSEYGRQFFRKCMDRFKDY